MISKRAASIKPSIIFSLISQAKELKKQGVDVISFGAGEPDFGTPKHIIDAAEQAMRSGCTKYTQTSGIPQLKEAICAKFKKENNLDYLPANIIVSTGAKQSLFNIIQVLVNPGDEVIIPVPYWVSYVEMVKLAGGICVFAPTKHFLLSAEKLHSLITPKTKAFILNSPSNPTGAVYEREALSQIAKVCVEKNIYVISDEIYEHLIYDAAHVSIASLGGGIKQKTIVVNGVSKAYAMTGWRIGYCAGPADIIKSSSYLQDHVTSNPNSIAQYAALQALTGLQDEVVKMREEYKKRRDFIVQELLKIKGVGVDKPKGAFYVFADVSKLYGGEIKGSMDFAGKLLEKERVVVIPGVAFGADEYVRFSYATGMEQLKKGLDRFARFVKHL